MPKPDLRHCRLYGIVDLGYVVPEQALEATGQLLAGGIDILQLRAKTLEPGKVRELAGAMHELTERAGIPLIINDYPEVALAVGAEGVHVGQDDVAVTEARSVIGNGKVVGKSTHSLDQATRAADEGADYIGFGPLFTTPTKPEYPPIGTADIGEVHGRVSLPVFCIGGIKLENLGNVLAAGARRVVIVSGLLMAKDIAGATREAQRILLESAI